MWASYSYSVVWTAYGDSIIARFCMKLVRAGGGLESGNPNGSERLIGRRRLFTMWRYSALAVGISANIYVLGFQ